MTWSPVGRHRPPVASSLSHYQGEVSCASRDVFQSAASTQSSYCKYHRNAVGSRTVVKCEYCGKDIVRIVKHFELNTKIFLLNIPLVLVEIILARKGFLALLTGEFLLPRVGDQMARQMLLATECLVATFFSALEGTQTRVQLNMLREMLLLFEFTLASWTGKRTSWCCCVPTGIVICRLLLWLR